MTLNEYLTPIFEELPGEVRRTCILAGGAIRAYYDGTTAKDYDLFFKSQEDFTKARRELQRFGYGIKCDNPPVPAYVSHSGRVFNLIGAYFGGASDIVDCFDFRCCQHWAVWTEVAGTPQAHSYQGAREDAADKVLNLVRHGELAAMQRREAHYMKDYGYVSNISGSDRHQCLHFPAASPFPAGNSGG